MPLGSATRAPGVLLISPGILKPDDADFGMPHLVALGSYLQHHLKVRVELLDLNYEQGGNHLRLLQTLEELGPHLVIGISLYSSFDHLRVLSLARFIRKAHPNTPLVVGGYHASALAKALLFDGSPFSAVVVGEGEEPMRQLVEAVMGGQSIDGQVVGPMPVECIDNLPPYDWTLLHRYLPKAHLLGRKFQIYLSRGCPFGCSFCMERVKGERRWRAFSPERAVEELERLARHTPLADWVVNVADPIFGLDRQWRQEVLSKVVSRKLLAEQYWTLTRCEDLDEEDIKALAKARFAVGVGLESANYCMLRCMNKASNPGRYLDAMERFAGHALKHGLNWAANIIVGHPGETRQSMEETHAYVKRLFIGDGRRTSGWLSVDPFRLYPGSQIHSNMQHYRETFGTVFYHPNWWTGLYDTPFKAEHLDPSSSLSFEERVRYTYQAYAPLVRQIPHHFAGQNRPIDKIFAKSMANQIRCLDDGNMHKLLLLARHKPPVGATSPSDDHAQCPDKSLSFPIGLDIRNPLARHLELAVRQALERGFIHSDAVVEALLSVNPEEFFCAAEVQRLLQNKPHHPVREGTPPRWLGFHTQAVALEALQILPGARVAVLAALDGYMAALMAALVGTDGQVVVQTPLGLLDRVRLGRQLAHLPNVLVRRGKPTTTQGLDGTFEAMWLGGAIPQQAPHLLPLLRCDGGRAVLIIGPRFGDQNLVCITKRGETPEVKGLAKVKVPALRGPFGWIMTEKWW